MSELEELKVKFAELVRLQQRHVTVANQLNQQIALVDAEIAKLESEAAKEVQNG